jgi:acyl-CoA synthetase (AMP-forming)/AMP-acid ligase II
MTDEHELIWSGGVAVSLAEVEGVWENHPAVAECCAFGVANQEAGQVGHQSDNK